MAHQLVFGLTGKLEVAIAKIFNSSRLALVHFSCSEDKVCVNGGRSCHNVSHVLRSLQRLFQGHCVDDQDRFFFNANCISRKDSFCSRSL